MSDYFSFVVCPILDYGRDIMVEVSVSILFLDSVYKRNDPVT